MLIALHGNCIAYCIAKLIVLARFRSHVNMLGQCVSNSLIIVSGMSLYNKTKWKGRELKLQLAKESFINK